MPTKVVSEADQHRVRQSIGRVIRDKHHEEGKVLACSVGSRFSFLRQPQELCGKQKRPQV